MGSVGASTCPAGFARRPAAPWAAASCRHAAPLSSTLPTSSTCRSLQHGGFRAWQATACHYNGAADDPLEPYSGEAAALPPPPPDYYNALPDSPQQQRPRRWLVGWLLDGVGGAVVRLWGGDKSCCSPSSANSAPAAEEYPLYDRAPRMG